MGSETDNIRRQIEDTRDQMSQTVEALGHKLDLPAQAREGVQNTVQSVKDTLSGGGGDAMEQAKQQGGRLKSMGEDNPFLVIVGAAALGFLIGLVVPPSRFEERQLEQMGVSDRARDMGHEAIERGKTVVQDVAQTARESVREQAQGMSH